MKKKLSNFILIFVFFIGLSLLLYPVVSDYWNSFHQTVAIATYTDAVAKMDNDRYNEMWKEAQAYNERLKTKKNRWILSDEEKEEYMTIMDVSGTGVIGYIEIPVIDCELPVYHGVDDAVLQVAIGHIEGSSLPIGGLGTHSVLSGHRGLPSAKLFSDLDDLVEGDVFLLQMLDETLAYEVDQISIVLPKDLENLEIEEDKDYCTLVTCTPYGINSHRLLVRGHRIDSRELASDLRVTADAMQIDPLIIAPIIAVPILLILLIVLLTQSSKRRMR